MIDTTVSVVEMLTGSGTHDPLQSVTMWNVVDEERCCAGCSENIFGSGEFVAKCIVAAPATTSDLLTTQ